MLMALWKERQDVKLTEKYLGLAHFTAYLIRDGSFLAQCGSFQPCNPCRRWDDKAWTDRLLGRSSLCRDASWLFFGEETPESHDAGPKTSCATADSKRNERLMQISSCKTKDGKKTQIREENCSYILTISDTRNKKEGTRAGMTALSMRRICTLRTLILFKAHQSLQLFFSDHHVGIQVAERLREGAKRAWSGPQRLCCIHQGQTPVGQGQVSINF